MSRAAPGEMFDREWFDIVERGPEGLAMARVRYWDRAATEGEKKAKVRPGDTTGPAWTAGVLMSRDIDGQIFIEHIDRFRGGPNEVERRIVERTKKDKQRFGDVRTVLEQDPGQAGKVEVHHYITKALQGFDVHAKVPSGDKVTRAKPLSAQCEHGNVRVVRGSWNEAWFAEAEMFPLGFKDQIDGASGAYGQLANGGDGEVTTGGQTELGGNTGGF